MGDGGSNPTSPHNLHLEIITKNQAAACYSKWHYLGNTELLAKVHFGVFLGGELKGAISYGPPNATDIKGIYDRSSQNGVWEIKRLALSDDLGKNSESRVIAVSLRLLRKIYPVKIILTYADTSVGHVGTIYRACGFNYKGLTAPKNDFWVNGKIQQRGKTKGVKGEWKPRSRKHLFIKNF